MQVNRRMPHDTAPPAPVRSPIRGYRGVARVAPRVFTGSRTADPTRPCCWTCWTGGELPEAQRPPGRPGTSKGCPKTRLIAPSRRARKGQRVRDRSQGQRGRASDEEAAGGLPRREPSPQGRGKGSGGLRASAAVEKRVHSHGNNPLG